MAEVKIFTGSAHPELAEKIAFHYGQSLGELKKSTFSDGEIMVSFNESIRGCDIYIIQPTFPPSDHILELLMMIDAAKRASANKVNLIVPYFGYARQDRKDKPRVSISSKLVANLFTAAGANRLITCDLHAGQIQGFFDFPVDHLYGSRIFVPFLKQLNLDNVVFASPDVGGVGRARAYAKYFEADIAVCDKHRKRANEIASMQVIGEVKDFDVILVDDMVDTGGTLCRAAEKIMEKGAKSVRAVCTHGVLSGKAFENIEDSVLEQLIISDTIPLKKPSEKITVLSVSEMFAEAIVKINENKSISSLFI